MRFRLRRCFVRFSAFVGVLVAGSGGFAFAGPSNGILYETFGSNGVSAINLADPSTGLGNLFTPATNIVAGGGQVYFESGNTIYSTSPDLGGLNTVLNNNQTPTDLALVTTAAVPEPSSITLVLAGLMCWGGRHAWSLIRQKA